MLRGTQGRGYHGVPGTEHQEKCKRKKRLVRQETPLSSRIHFAMSGEGFFLASYWILNGSVRMDRQGAA